MASSTMVSLQWILLDCLYNYNQTVGTVCYEYTAYNYVDKDDLFMEVKKMTVTYKQLLHHMESMKFNKIGLLPGDLVTCMAIHIESYMDEADRELHIIWATMQVWLWYGEDGCKIHGSLTDNEEVLW